MNLFKNASSARTLRLILQCEKTLTCFFVNHADLLHSRPIRPSLTERTERHLNTNLQMMRRTFSAMCRVRDNFNLQLVVSGGAVLCYSRCRPVPQRTGCTHRLFSLISTCFRVHDST